MIFQITYFLSFSILCFTFEKESCKQYQDILPCEFLIPKSPIHFLSSVIRSGVNQSQCLHAMERFDWPTGLFCPESGFCGLGINLNAEAASVKTTDVTEVTEVCQVFFDRTQTDCDSIRSSLYGNGILRGKCCWYFFVQLSYISNFYIRGRVADSVFIRFEGVKKVEFLREKLLRTEPLSKKNSFLEKISCYFLTV